MSHAVAVEGPAAASGAVADGSDADRPWRRAAISAAVAWITSHLAYAIVNLNAWRVGRLPPPQTGDILSAWQRWDTGHYIRIADGGYGQVPLDSAFFPLYPLLIKIANVILPGGTLVAALAVSSVAVYLALMVLHRLASFEFGESTAARTVFYLVAFPTAFFLSAAYNASLSVLLAASALYAMRRGHWWAAGGFAGLASANRSSGVLLALPFALEYLRQHEFSLRKIRVDLLAIALVPSGLIAFSIYLKFKVGDALAFSHAQAFWYRSVDWPWVPVHHALQEIHRYRLLQELSVVNLIDLGAAVAFGVLMVLTLVGPWKLRRDQLYLAVYGFAVLALPLVTPASDSRPLISMARHVLECLPAFMILGRTGANRYFDRIYPMPAIAFQCMLLAVFMHYDWAG